jgi:dTDP-glucose 4,6-dehydratase
LDRVAEVGRPGETYLIGARGERRNIEVVRTICSILDQIHPLPEGATPRSDLIRLVKDRPGHDFRYAIDPADVENRLGWRAEQTFESALRETVEWYLANTEWCNQAAAIYRRSRLGLAIGAE